MPQRLTDEQVLAIYRSPQSHKKIAEKFGVCVSTVSKIKRGVRRADLVGPTERVKRIRTERLLKKMYEEKPHLKPTSVITDPGKFIPSWLPHTCTYNCVHPNVKIGEHFVPTK